MPPRPRQGTMPRVVCPALDGGGGAPRSSGSPRVTHQGHTLLFGLNGVHLGRKAVGWHAAARPHGSRGTNPVSDQARATVVFYDGGCPLCSREISHYRRLDRDKAVEWLDLHQSGDRLSQAGIDFGAAMARLHVIEPQWGLVSGVHGFVAIWRRLPYYRHLARLVEGLRLTGPLDRVYDRFARWRLRRRCGGGVCGLPGQQEPGSPGRVPG